MKITMLPLPYWVILIIAFGFLSGCASPEYTTRKCVIVIAGQAGENAFYSQLFCEREEAYSPESK